MSPSANGNGHTPVMEEEPIEVPAPQLADPNQLLNELADAGFHLIPEEIIDLVGKATVGRAMAEAALRKSHTQINDLRQENERLRSDLDVMRARVAEFEGGAEVATEDPFPEPSDQTEPAAPEAEATP